MAKCKKGFRFNREKKSCEKVIGNPRQINYDTSGGGGIGVGFTGLLTLLFIGLKIIGKINWSWWWVLSPIWISFAIGIILFLIFVIF